MTGRERLLAAIRRRGPDRVPVSPRCWAWLIDYYGDCRLGSYLRFCRQFGADALYTVPNPHPRYEASWPRQYDLPGVKVEQTRHDDGRIEVIARTFHTPAGKLTDTVRLPPPGSRYGVSPPAIHVERLVKRREDLEPLRYLQPPVRHGVPEYDPARAAIGEAGLAEVHVQGPLDGRAADARDLRELMADYHEDRAFFDAQISFHAGRMLDETQAVLQAGVEVVLGGWCSESLSAGWTPAAWKEVFFPWLRRQVRMVHDAGALYHFFDNGRIMPLLPLLADAGVDLASSCSPPPVGDFDLADAKTRFGHRLSFEGCIDALHVVKPGPPERIVETVRQSLAVGGQAGCGFVLGVSDTLRDGTPVDHVRAYFAAAQGRGHASADRVPAAVQATSEPAAPPALMTTTPSRISHGSLRPNCR